MAEGDDPAQKTEEPTPKKLREAREKGQVALSREINNWVMLAAIGLIVAAMGGQILEDFTLYLRRFLESAHLFPTDNGSLGNVLTVSTLEAGMVLFLPILLLVVFAFLSGFAQTGPLITVEQMKPKLEKLSPLKGFKRVFGVKGWVEFIKGVAKLLAVTVIAWFVLRPVIKGGEGMVGMDWTLMLKALRSEVLQLLFAVLVVMFFVAIFDYIVQKYQLNKQLRMSKQEIKDEYKQTEGDPHVKARLRELRVQKARQRMMQKVPEADVVITNPTHFAVALEYKQDTMQAPVLLAKGQDKVAFRIREMAEEHEVPVVENPPLARILHATVELDEEIPEEHYKAVAEVISFVYSLKKQTSRT